MSMGTIRETAGQITIIRASPGTLGRRNSEELGRELAALSGPGPLVVIDLSLVDRIDEAGFGAILAYQRLLAGQGGRLHVCGLSRSVRLLFLLLCLHRRLEVFNSEYEAIEAFRQSKADDAG
jgi:anti-anti-sigma regulatory factor